MPVFNVALEFVTIMCKCGGIQYSCKIKIKSSSKLTGGK